MTNKERRHWIKAFEAAEQTIAVLQRNALPTDCTGCGGSGADLPGSPESGPCELCGGWSARKRERAALLSVAKTARAIVGCCECDLEVTGHTGACLELTVALAALDQLESSQ